MLANLDKYDGRFKKIFGVSIKPFYSRLLLMVGIQNFDIVAFDRWLRTPNNVSIQDYVKEKFGQEGVDLINEILENEI